MLSFSLSGESLTNLMYDFCDAYDFLVSFRRPPAESPNNGV